MNGIANLSRLQRLYKQHKYHFDTFLKKNIARGESNDACELFSYLCYNLLLTAVNGDIAKRSITYLKKSGILFEGNVSALGYALKKSGYRFPNKGKWLWENRLRYFEDGCEIGIVTIVSGLSNMNPVDARNMLADGRIKGMGMKTASHFLRGLGLSHNELAILDTYILDWLEKFQVVTNLPRNSKGKLRRPTKDQYLSYEKKMKKWSVEQVHIPLDVLDLLLWEMGRGDI